MFKGLFKAVKNWWLLFIIGIVSLVCGIILVFNPAIAFNTMAILLTVELFVAGVTGIIFVISNRKEINAWGLHLILPILLIIFGFITVGTFGGSQVFLICFFAAGVLFKGCETITYAISLSHIKGSGWGWTLAGGILVIIFAGFLFANPIFNAVFVAYMASFAMVFIGIDAIVVSIQLSKVKSAAKAVAKEIEETTQNQ